MQVGPARSLPGLPARPIEVSIVMPCLNEAATLAACITKARSAIERHALSAEIIVADNGSTDGSQMIARELDARVVSVSRKGYGSALRGGIEAARGKYIVMADSDDSYDFGSIYPFVEKLREGYDLVMGNRFQGGIRGGAMPWMHRWVGNPVLTRLGRLFFRSSVGDFHCGLRAFKKDAYHQMELKTTGMEFASEMVVRASLLGMHVGEVPTILYKDGRSHPPHLRTWRDGWRHLRFMLLFSPRWLFFTPGVALFLVGLFASAWLIGGPRRVGSLGLDIHTLLVAGVMCLIGYQLIVFAAFTKIFAIREGFHPPSRRLNRLFPYVTLEVGLLAGCLMTLVGLVTMGVAVWSWERAGFGALDPRVTMREAIPAVVLIALGVQTIFASFFLSILGIGVSDQAAWQAALKNDAVRVRRRAG
jgi:glycosyltransferase involved in cell wall biosynthesis